MDTLKAVGRQQVDENAEMKLELAELREEVSTLRHVLRDMEWLGLNDGRGVTHRQCPACSALQSRGTGHNAFCGLAAAIAKAEGK